MNKKIVEQYLGKNVEIMLMPDGRKTSGCLLSCEQDFFSLSAKSGPAFYAYPMVWGIVPIELEQTEIETQTRALTQPTTPTPPKTEPKAEPMTETETKKEPETPPIEEEMTISFLDDLDECYDDIDAKSESFTLNVDYVRKFRTNRHDKIQAAMESILTKYLYAVEVHEDRPYMMRMRQILDDAKNLWRSNQSSKTASEIYGFILYLMGENSRSVKIYMSIHDFHAAFCASSSAPSRMLAAACIIVSEPLSPKNFAVLLKIESTPIITALLRWILAEVVNNSDMPVSYKELCFRCVCALSWKLLSFDPETLPEKSALFSQPNINALNDWLLTQQSDDKIIEDALKLSDKSKLSLREDAEKYRRIDWTKQLFEGDFEYFNPNPDKLYGFIKCPVLKRYNVPLRSEGSVFVHINQIEDRNLRRKLLLCGKMKPMFRVTFLLGNNVEGPAAYAVKERTEENIASLSVDMMSALSEEGEITYFDRYYVPPFGKIKPKNEKDEYTFNETNITDPLLAVYLEVDPSPEGHPVRFTRGMNSSGKVQIRNIESAVPFPEERVKAWDGMIKKAEQRLNISTREAKPESEEYPIEPTPEIEEIIARNYTPLESYTPETKGQRSNPRQQTEPTSRKPKLPETFLELPKFLQDKILKTSTTGKLSNQYLTDSYYAKGHYREVKAGYLSMLGKFDDVSVTNAEKAERCFSMARYVYNFFTMSDPDEQRQYPASEEDNIRIMAYKGLEYLLYSQLDGAKRNEGNYDTARRYCLLKLADEIQQTRRIDENNEWLRIYIYSYFVNGLRFHGTTGKWSAQNVSLSGYSLLEFNDFGKFFDGLLTLAYVTGGELIMPTLKALLHSPEYSGSLLGKLGLDTNVYSQDSTDTVILEAFKRALEGKRDVVIVDAEVRLSPELLRILSVQKMIVRLMKEELSRILQTSPGNLDEALKKVNPILASEEYANSLAKTQRKYNPEAGLLDVLPINVLGSVMRKYWTECFGAYFGGKPYVTYWKERFAKLQWVRDPVFHAHPEYIKDKDIEEVKSVCKEIVDCINKKKTANPA